MKSLQKLSLYSIIIYYTIGGVRKLKSFLNWLSSGKTIASIVVVIVALALFFILRKLGRKYKNSEKSKGQMATVIRVSFSIADFLVLLAMILIILRINGINITSMVAGLGIASAIIGLALQDLLKDVIMGINIMTDHFFAVGECVEYNGREGIVTGFTLKSTKIGDLADHSIMTVSNRNISEIRRLGERYDVVFPISYEESREKARDAILNICRSLEEEKRISKCEYKGIDKLDASALQHKIRIYCEPKYRAEVKMIANNAIVKGLDEAGIKIPYNQLDVHIDKQD